MQHRYRQLILSHPSVLVFERFVAVDNGFQHLKLHGVQCIIVLQPSHSNGRLYLNAWERVYLFPTNGQICHNIYSFIHHCLYSPLLGPGLFFRFVGLLGRGISPSQSRYIYIEQHKHRSMPRVGFEPTIPASEQAKTVHALDRAATVIVSYMYTILNLLIRKECKYYLTCISCISLPRFTTVLISSL
jgi:hypothetical protein